MAIVFEKPKALTDGDAESVQYAGHIFVTGVTAKTRARHALEVFDCIDLVDGVILEGDLDDAGGIFAFLELVVEDVALVEEDLGDLLLQV